MNRNLEQLRTDKDHLLIYIIQAEIRGLLEELNRTLEQLKVEDEQPASQAFQVKIKQIAALKDKSKCIYIEIGVDPTSMQNARLMLVQFLMGTVFPEMSSWDKNNILEQIYKKQLCSELYLEDFDLYNIPRICIIT